MSARDPQIVAFGGGGFSMEPGNPLLDEFVLSLTGAQRPKVCFLPTASGDADHYVVRFYRAFSPARCEPSHVSLFRRDRGSGMGADIAAHLLAQDLIYVGGGSVVSLLGVWRAHGVDEVLRECWARGVVLCGLSAGSLCWFAEAVTAFHGPPQPVAGLGLLPFSNCVHFDGEPERREGYRRFVAGGMAPGYGAGDGAALHFRGTELAGVVASRPLAGASWVQATGGEVAEVALPVRRLGASPALAAA
jgi:peptidase E